MHATVGMEKLAAGKDPSLMVWDVSTKTITCVLVAL